MELSSSYIPATLDPFSYICIIIDCTLLKEMCVEVDHTRGGGGVKNELIKPGIVPWKAV